MGTVGEPCDHPAVKSDVSPGAASAASLSERGADLLSWKQAPVVPEPADGQPLPRARLGRAAGGQSLKALLWEYEHRAGLDD